MIDALVIRVEVPAIGPPVCADARVDAHARPSDDGGGALGQKLCDTVCGEGGGDAYAARAGGAEDRVGDGGNRDTHVIQRPLRLASSPHQVTGVAAPLRLFTLDVYDEQAAALGTPHSWIRALRTLVVTLP